MDRISGLPDELLVKIVSLLPPKAVVSTSILSKRWNSLWLWVPKLEFVLNHYKSDSHLRDFITKNLSLLKPPVLETFRLECFDSTFQPEDIKNWVRTTVSRCVRELNIKLNIKYCDDSSVPRLVALLPSSLYICKSLVALKLDGQTIMVDAPRTVDLPSLKTLELCCVTYANKDSLRLLLSCCTVLEDLAIYRDGEEDNLKSVVIIVPSLLRLSLGIEGNDDDDDDDDGSYGYEIKTPSLKYFKITDFYREYFSYLIMHMPNVEEADISVDEDVETLFESITSIKRLSLSLSLTVQDKITYRNGIVFNQLEHLELLISHDKWSKTLIRLLEDSPKLRVLKITNDGYEHVRSWNNDDVPNCLLESLEICELAGYRGRQEEIDFVSFILENARHLKPSSISQLSLYVLE